uniref:Uncharacterized protein n=1 Tax=Rhizophora mucronata TaxID=61149 RepID=A0A2P2P0Y7_RHIMU
MTRWRSFLLWLIAYLSLIFRFLKTSKPEMLNIKLRLLI